MHKILFRLVVLCAFFTMYSCKENTIQKPIVGQEFLLGTPIVIQIFEGGSDMLIEDIFYKTEEIEAAMSTSTQDYSSSEIINMNNTSQKTPSNITRSYSISRALTEVLARSLEIAEITQGGFDPSIQTLVALWGFGTGEVQTVPSRKKIERVLAYVNWKTLGLDETSRIFFMQGQQGIDVGGIAKGYAADLARKKLLDAGVSSAILDFGGNIITIGKKKSGAPWKIGIQAPFKEQGTVLLTIEIDAASIVTSGIYEKFFEYNDAQYSHLINPNTGYPVDNNLASVSIIAEDSIFADGLSTGIFVLGLKEGMKVIESLADTEAIFVSKDKKIYISSGVESLNLDIKDKSYVLTQ